MDGTPQLCNCFIFYQNTILLIIFCASFYNIFIIEGESFKIVWSFARGWCPMLVTWSLPWFYWLTYTETFTDTQRIILSNEADWRWSPWLLKSIHYCFYQTPGFGQILGLDSTNAWYNKKVPTKNICNKEGYYWSGMATRLLLQFVNEDQVLYFLYFPDTDDKVNKLGLSCAQLSIC